MATDSGVETAPTTRRTPTWLSVDSGSRSQVAPTVRRQNGRLVPSPHLLIPPPHRRTGKRGGHRQPGYRGAALAGCRGMERKNERVIARGGAKHAAEQPPPLRPSRRHSMTTACNAPSIDRQPRAV
ncbi:hypothetical protein BKA81DRAFT_381534 [Phyllosticta paracitricarpa]